MAQHQNQYSAAQTDEYGNPTHTTGIGGTGHNTCLGTGDHQQQQHQHQHHGLGDMLKERMPGVGGNNQDDQCLGQGQDRRPTVATTQGQGHGYGATNTQGIGGTTNTHQGIGEKIKERIPGVGGNKQDDQYLGQGQDRHPTAATTGLAYGATNTHGQGQGQGYVVTNTQGIGGTTNTHQGIGEKIKERIPGVGGNKQDDQYLGQGQDRRPTAATTGLAYGATNTHGQGQGQGYGATNTQGIGAGQNQEKKGMMDKIKEKLPGAHNK